MMFETRSRGFSELLLDQSFCGWLCAPRPVDFFGARPLPAAERGLGWGQGGSPLAARPRRETTPPVTPLPKSHLTHPTTLTPPDPPEPRCAAVFFKRRHRIPSWRTLSACRVETRLDAWYNTSASPRPLLYKQPNKPNLAKPQWNQWPTADRPTAEPRAAARGPAPAGLAGNAQVLIMGTAPNASGSLLWRTLSACRVETPLYAWWRSNPKQPNKPNLAKPQWNQWLLRVKNASEGRSGGITFQLQRGCSASAPRRCDRVEGSVPDGSIAPCQARLHLVPAGVSQAAGVPRRTPADGRKKVQTAMLECRSCSLMRL